LRGFSSGKSARAYMGLTQSRDLYGDGSIVIVPAPGHTPGSVVVFVTLPGGARYAFVGDLADERPLPIPLPRSAAFAYRGGSPWDKRA